jgi:cell division protein FtsB
MRKVIMSFRKKRPRPKKKLSPIQENRLVKIIFVILVLVLLWVLFSPGSGIVTLISKRSELKKLQQENMQLEQENTRLQTKIDRLQNDTVYLEEIARKDYGLLKKNEQVYDFSRSKPKEKK